MNHIRILQRAFDITRNYRVLWIFGILVALTTGRGSGNPGSSAGAESGGRGAVPPTFPNIPMPEIPPGVISSILGVGIALLCFLILLGVIFTIARYVGLTALVRMVDRFESSGERVSWREGFRLGWSRRALRAWLVDLLFGLGIFLLFLLFLLLAAAPLLVWFINQEALAAIGTVTAIGLGLLFIFFLTLLAALVSVLGQFFRRAIILEDLSIGEAIRRGWQLVTRRAGDVLLMALILFGLGLGITLVMVPVVIALAILAVMAGGLPGVLAGLLIHQLTSADVMAVIIGLLIGMPVFLLIMIIPLSLINGIVEVFTSSTWTLTYRELRALETVEADPVI